MKHPIIKYRWPIIIASLAVAAGFSFLLFRMEVEPDLSNYFPESMTSMQNTDRIEEIFGNQDLVMIVFESVDILRENSLRRVKQLVGEFNRLEGVRRTTSLFGSNRIHGEAGIMYVEPTVRRIPGNEKDREELREVIRSNELVYNIMVSDDFRATSVILSLEEDADEDRLFSGIHSLLEEFPGEETVHFGGLPYLRRAIDRDIRRDGLVLIPVALMLMLIFLYLVFREWRGVWLPFLVVVISSLIGIALIPVLGWKFYVITLLVPILLIAVANDYGIHMIARYQELNAEGNGTGMKEMAVRITQSLWRPILLTGVTTIAGISALWAHSMIPARQMAFVASAGILFAVFFSLVLLPALLSLLKKPEIPPRVGRNKKDGGWSLLGRFAFGVVRHRRLIPPVALGITLLISGGIFFLEVDSNEENFFPEKHEVKQAARIINGKFGGSENISILFTGDMLDPAILRRMESYREELEKLEPVDLTLSFSGVVREISKALNDPGDPLYDRIPPSREAVAQYMELYSMSGDPGELEQLVDFTYSHGHLMIRINDANNGTVNGIIDRIEQLTGSDPAVERIGGNGYIRAELASRVQTGTFYSLGIALAIIFLLISFIFRSGRAGLLGVIPLLVSVVLLFGIMGLTGIRLDVATALLSSVMIGVGVDYTIHFLWRYREERRQNRIPKEAVITTIHTTGRGIIFNALSVMVGFVVLLISSFSPIRFFGVLVVVSIFSCLVGALVILPALVLRFRFGFLERPESRNLSPRGSGLRIIRRIAMLGLIAFMALLTTSAQEAREMIRKSRDAVKVSSFEAVSTLTITDSRGNPRIRKNSMASMSLPDGTEKRIIRFLSPPEVKGTGILIFDYPEKSDDMWIYLPALRRTRRIVSREKSKSFMGSEFSNANMAAPGLDDFTYRLSGGEIYRGNECHLVESLPRSGEMEDRYGYTRAVSWVDKNSYLVHRTDYYGFDGELFKTITHEEFREVDKQSGTYMVTRMQAVNHGNGRSSEMVMEKVAVVPTKESYFTVDYLERQ